MTVVASLSAVPLPKHRTADLMRHDKDDKVSMRMLESDLPESMTEDRSHTHRALCWGALAGTHCVLTCRGVIDDAFRT